MCVNFSALPYLYTFSRRTVISRERERMRKHGRRTYYAKHNKMEIGLSEHTSTQGVGERGNGGTGQRGQCVVCAAPDVRRTHTHGPRPPRRTFIWINMQNVLRKRNARKKRTLFRCQEYVFLFVFYFLFSCQFRACFHLFFTVGRGRCRRVNYLILHVNELTCAHSAHTIASEK